jgi:hypothetical protein
MKYISEENYNSHSGIYDIKISVTKGGLPRILPSYMRVMLRAKHI